MSLIKCKECGAIVSDKATNCPRCGCPIADNATSVGNMLPVGTMLGDGRYRIEQHLGSGGFGNTYIATDLNFNDHVAVKEFFMQGVTLREENGMIYVNVPESLTLFEEQLAKFKKEAMRLRRLNNPHIVRVQDLFEANGTVYYVMDYVEGESLAARMKRTGQPLSEAEAMHYFSQMLDALQAVHAEGLCHLDIKPDNIMVDKEGNAVLIDFGASKQMAGGNATRMTSVAYTIGFAAIEQVEQDVAHFGPWSDIYALGATLYSLLNNTDPPMPSTIFTDSTPLKQTSLPFTANVSLATRELILKMMAMRWDSRPQSINELRTLMAKKPSKAGKATVISPIEDEDGHEEKGFLARKKWLVAALAGVLVILGAIWLLLSKQPSSDTVATNTENTATVPNTDSPETSTGTNEAQKAPESQPVEVEVPSKKEAQPEEPQKSEPAPPSPAPVTEPAPKSPPPGKEALSTNPAPEKTTSGRKSLGYGTYEGTLRNGQPDDVKGRLTFTASHVIDSRDPKKRMAEPGDYVIGEFSEGHLVQGIWYGSDGSRKGSIIIGK